MTLLGRREYIDYAPKKKPTLNLGHSQKEKGCTSFFELREYKFKNHLCFLID